MIFVAQRFPKVGTRFAIHCTFSSYARQISAALRYTSSNRLVALDKNCVSDDAVADGRVADKVRARRNHSRTARTETRTRNVQETPVKWAILHQAMINAALTMRSRNRLSASPTQDRRCARAPYIRYFGRGVLRQRVLRIAVKRGRGIRHQKSAGRTHVV